MVLDVNSSNIEAFIALFAHLFIVWRSRIQIRQIQHSHIHHFKNEKKLSRVNFRKDFLDCYQDQGKTLINSWLARHQ